MEEKQEDIFELDWSQFKFAEKVTLDEKRLVVFDTECNELLEKVTRMWVIVCMDYATKEFYVFTDQDTGDCPCHGTLEEGVDFLAACRGAIAHNYVGYDWYVLNKFFPKKWNRKTVPIRKCHDTFVQSKTQWYERPAMKGVKGTHGLAYYGHILGAPKPPIEDWSYWDLDKLHRCLVDVEINARTYDYLNREKKELKDKFGIDFKFQMDVAKYTQWRCTQQEMNGFKADEKLMHKHLDTLVVDIKVLTDEVEPQLPKKVCQQNLKATWEEVRDKCKAVGVRFFTKVPATEYELKKKDGEIVDAPIKKTYMPTLKWRSAAWKAYPKPNEKLGTKPKKDGTWKYTKTIQNWFDIPEDPLESDTLVEGAYSKCDLEKMYFWEYDTHTARWFDIDQVPGNSDELVGGMYTKVYFEDVQLTQHAEVKKFLLTLGWVPDEWTRKKDVYGKFMKDSRGGFVNGSPKLTESSFVSLPEGIGQKIAKYNTLMHRRRMIYNDKIDPKTDELEKGWLNNIREDGRLSAGAQAFNTATGRMTQYGIVNCPSPHAVFGKPMREVWIAEEGCDLVSTDMASAQLMILAGYMGDKKFAEAVSKDEFIELDENPGEGKYCELTSDGKYKVYLGEDAHTMNSVYFKLNTLEDIEEARKTQDPKLVHKVSGRRKLAKNGIYALLFGSGDAKFATTVGLKTAKAGKAIKEHYFKELPKLAQVKKDLEKQFDKNKVGEGGYIQVGGGVWLYCFSKHKVLNYLLMGTEAQVQNCAIIWKCDQYDKLGIPAKQVLTIHDEQTDECPKEYTDRVKEIQSQMYLEASKILKLAIPVTGDAVAGSSYLAVH